MPKVCAKGRNNDPTLPANERELHFDNGRGFAVDVRVRNWPGRAAERYAEGAIVTIVKTAEEAERVAHEINSGERYGPGHHFHGLAYNAIVVPAWNYPPPGQDWPWETTEGSAEMVKAYEKAGVPIPRWLQNILAELGAQRRGNGEKRQIREPGTNRDHTTPTASTASAPDTSSQVAETSSATEGSESLKAVDRQALLDRLRVIHPERHDGQQAPYQFLVLLWAISGARQGRRLRSYRDVRQELAEILSPFRLADSAPNPANPWYALNSSDWWEIVPPLPTSYKEVHDLDSVAGLRQPVYELLANNTNFAAQAVGIIAALVGDSPNLQDLIVHLELSQLSVPPPPYASPELIDVEKHTTERFIAEYKALAAEERERREAKLQAAYRGYLIAQGHKVSRYKIPIDNQYLYTDLYDESTQDLIEVKASSDRVTMRLALGQILDYAKHVKHAIRTVLVPEPPPTAIIDLFSDYKVRIVWPDGTGGFQIAR